jgi:hypothetical protein
MTYHVLEKSKFTVAAILSLADDWTTQCDALSFLHAASQNKNTASSCKGYHAVFARLAEHGPSGLTSALMHEVNKEEAIYELIKGDLRLFCFIQGEMIFLANGYIKKSQKADKTEVARAIKIKKAYYSQPK